MLLLRSYTTIEASRFRNKVKKIILAEANVEMFNTLGTLGKISRKEHILSQIQIILSLSGTLHFD